jgi:general secretion pathway protein L
MVDVDCLYALAADDHRVEREGEAPLSELRPVIARAQRTVLIIAASDVTLLRVKTPPLSAARLRAALPNIVEDQLIADPADCAIAAGDQVDGLRTVAVVQRAWLNALLGTVIGAGARRIVAVPSQLCLPHSADMLTAAALRQGLDVDLAVRLSEQEGIGLPVMPERPENVAPDVVQSLRAIVPGAAIRLYVPPSDVAEYEAVGDEGIFVLPDQWSHWIAGASQIKLNLLTGLGAASGPSINWRAWRWPAILAAALVLINVIALNSDWWRLRGESEALRASMTRIYRTAYPNETVIVDPIAQMRQKIDAAKRDSGQPAPEDFASLVARFGQAWNNAARSEGAESAPAIAGLEYRDRMLTVKLKSPAGAELQPVKTAAAARGLTVEEVGPDTWRIGNAK